MLFETSRSSEARPPVPPTSARQLIRSAATVRCRGRPSFRSPSVRDYGFLLDVDPDVIAWTCRPEPFTWHDRTIAADFTVERSIATVHILIDDGGCPASCGGVADDMEGVEVIDPRSLEPDRIANARDLLRYAFWHVSMSDRIRILATLESEGSLTLGECLSIRTASDPIASIAALAVRREVEIDLDSGRIGPETRVSRIRT